MGGIGAEGEGGAPRQSKEPRLKAAVHPSHLRPEYVKLKHTFSSLYNFAHLHEYVLIDFYA